MYHVSPFTYLVGAVLSVGLADAHVRCSEIELLHFDPVPGTSCEAYMSTFMETSMGYLTNPDATEDCTYCALDTADGFLRSFGIRYEDRWRNFGIIWVFVAFNIAGAFFFYWLVRVPKRNAKVDVQHNELQQTILNTALTESQQKELEKARHMREMFDEGKFVSSVPVSRAGPTDCEM